MKFFNLSLFDYMHYFNTNFTIFDALNFDFCTRIQYLGIDTIENGNYTKRMNGCSYEQLFV